MDFIRKHKYALLLLIPGIIGGFLYWKYVGCVSGTCAIKSNQNLMMLFGALIGYVAGDSVDDIIKKRKNKKENENN